MTAKTIQSSPPITIGLPKALEKKIHYDKVQIICLAIFTCGLSYGIRAAVRCLKKKLINQVFLPAAFMQNTYPINCQRSVSLPLHNKDGICLDVRKYERSLKSRRWLVYCCGNGMQYQEYFDQLMVISRIAQANLLVFNYRGVGNSEGRPINFRDLTVDGATCIEYLKKIEKVKEENIVIWGYSLGGAVATHVASYYNKVKVFNDRSFDHSLVTVYYLFKKGIYGLFGMLIVFFTGSVINVGKAWRKIPNPQKMMSYHKYDGVVQYPSSLHKAEKQRGGKLPKVIEITGGTKVVDPENHGDLNAQDMNRIIRGIKRLFNQRYL